MQVRSYEQGPEFQFSYLFLNVNAIARYCYVFKINLIVYICFYTFAHLFRKRGVFFYHSTPFEMFQGLIFTVAPRVVTSS